MTIFEEILEAQNQSHYLGLKWKIPTHIVEGIHSQYSSPKDRLFHVVVEFLKQVEPRPTWGAVVDALKSPVVGLPHLAKRVERNHCQLMTPPSFQAGSQMMTYAPYSTPSRHSGLCFPAPQRCRCYQPGHPVQVDPGNGQTTSVLGHTH